MSRACSPGSGTAFSLLPAENATGNYVKIVQRVPVKIIIDHPPADVALGPGMSVVPTVRVDPAPFLYRADSRRPRRAGGDGYERGREPFGRSRRGESCFGQSVADRRPGRACHVHGGARHHGRQCGAALYRRRHGRQHGRGLLGGDDLSCRQRREPHGEPLPRPPARPQNLLSDLFGAVHGGLDRLRRGLEPGFAALLPHLPGPSRRRHGAGVAVDSGGFLPAGETRPGIRAIRRRGGGGPGGRPGARRLVRRQSGPGAGPS